MLTEPVLEDSIMKTLLSCEFNMDTDFSAPIYLLSTYIVSSLRRKFRYHGHIVSLALAPFSV